MKLPAVHGMDETLSLYWNHYIGFQLPNALTLNWQLWQSRYSPLLNLNLILT